MDVLRLSLKVFIICIVVVLASPGVLLASEDGSLSVRLAGILNKPSDLQADDVAFLNAHPTATTNWATAMMHSTPFMGAGGEIPNPKLVRLVCMIQEADPDEADRLGAKAITGMAELIKEVKTRRGESLTKALLACGDVTLEKAGISAAARNYPSMLIRALEMGMVDDVAFAVKELGRNKAIGAIPALRSIAESNSSEDVRAIAEMALANIKEEVPDESLVKSDPVATARSYVEHVRHNPDWFTSEELEFTLNPVLRGTKGAEVKWEEFVADGKDTTEGRRELEKRNALADALELALRNPDNTFVAQEAKCHVVLDGKVVATFHKDMMGRWRLYKNP